MTRDCPSCGELVAYKHPGSYHRAVEQNRVCKKCRYIVHPVVGRPMPVHVKEKLRLSHVGKPAWNRGVPMQDSTKKKLSASLIAAKANQQHWNLGRVCSPETRKRLSDAHRGPRPWAKGKSHTEETKKKIRESLAATLSKKKCPSRYNPKACEYIDRLNASRGWNLIHAKNGGEFAVCGYFLDGFDKDNRIVFEYDEPRHHLERNREKDKRRQTQIIEFFKSINAPVKFFRYDEKHDILYEVAT